MRPAQRFRRVAAAVAAVEAAAGIPLAGTILGPYFWACAAATLAVGLGASRFLEGPPRPPGGGPGRPAPGAPPEPPWWPGFERRLREYQSSRETAPTV